MSEQKTDKNGQSPWVDKVQERIQDATNWGMLVQMFTNASYFIGNQWIYWSRADRRIREAPAIDGQVRITHNKVRPRVMNLLNKLTKSKVRFDVMPDTPSQERVDIAKASKKFLDYWWEDVADMNQKTKDIHLYDIIYGWCAAKVWFDPEKGTDITPDSEELKETLKEKGYKDGQQVFTGEIECRICDPLTIYVDPSATSEDDIRWIIERKPRDIDYIKETYDVDVLPDENVDYLSQFDVNNMVYNNNLGIGTNQSKRRKNMAMVDEMWVMPTKKYPNGVKATIAGGKLLDLDENPGPHPYVIFKFMPIPSRVQGEGLIKDMIPIQKEINIHRTMMATHGKRMGNSVWIVPMGSGVEEEELTNEEGAIIHYNATTGAEPKRVPPPDLPNFYDRNIEFLMQDMDDLSGAREISQGRLPKGLDTASGLQMMIEQENEKLTIAAHNYERGMKKLLQRVLQLMQKHYTEERQARILGEDNEIELISFTGADLSGGEDINIVEGSSLPESKAAQEERIMNLWAAGAIRDKSGNPDHVTLLKLLNMGDSSEIFEEEQLDENKAKMENKFFCKLMEDQELYQAIMQHVQAQQMAEQLTQEMQQQYGQQLSPEELQQIVGEHIKVPPLPPGYPTVRDFHDHMVHLYQHNLFRKSHEYDELPPEIQQLLDDHVKQHQDIVSQSQQPAMKPPSESINFKDLPIDGKVQMAQHAGIQLNPDSLQAMEQQQQAMNQKPMPDQGQQFQQQLALKQVDHQNNMDLEHMMMQREQANAMLKARLEMDKQSLQHQMNQQNMMMQPKGGGMNESN